MGVMNDGEHVTLEPIKISKSTEERNAAPVAVAPEYDPHEHRHVPHPTTNWETLIHILKGSLGTGILAMPQAFSNAGLILGLVSTLAIGFICTYCLHMLVKCQYEICKRKRVPVIPYPESLKEALLEGPQCLRILAKVAVPVVNIFLILYQMGICSVYVVFLANNIKRVSDFYWITIDERIWMVVLLVPLILMNFIRNLKVLAPFSQIANIITFVGIGITMYYIFDGLPPLSSRDYVGKVGNYVLFVGTVLFALEAVGVIIALENNMKTPKSFGGYFGVLNQGMVVIVLLYAFVGFFGYVKYGPECRGSITLNLDNSQILAQSVNIMFSVAIFITYNLQCYVPVDILWNLYFKNKYEDDPKKALALEYGLRTAIVLVTFLLAVAIPRLGLFISLFGALCLSALGLVFPSLIHLCVRWPDKLGKWWFILWKDVLLIICGFLGLVIGTSTSIRDIVLSFTTEGVDSVH